MEWTNINVGLQIALDDIESSGAENIWRGFLH
jgi:hypothetical protein